METKETALLGKLRGLFAIEADEHLHAITKSLLALEKHPESALQEGVAETLFREVHTLKGAARAVNLSEVEAVCQVVESLCAGLKRKEIGVWPELFDALHRAMDVVRQLSVAPEGAVGGQVAGLVEELSRLEAQGRSRAGESTGKSVDQPLVEANSVHDPQPLQETPSDAAPVQAEQSPSQAPEEDGILAAPQGGSVEEALVPGKGKRRRTTTTTKKTAPRRPRSTKKKAVAEESTLAPALDEPVRAEAGASPNACLASIQPQEAVPTHNIDASGLNHFQPPDVGEERIVQEESVTSNETPRREDHPQQAMVERLRGLFIIEAEEHLQAITGALLALEQQAPGGNETALLETLLRCTHSLKGAARAVNLHDVETVCQAVENVCAALKRREFELWPECFDALHHVIDLVQQLIAEPESAAREGVAEALTTIKQLETNGRERAVQKRTVQLTASVAPEVQEFPLDGSQAPDEESAAPRFTVTTGWKAVRTVAQPRKSGVSQETSQGKKKSGSPAETVRIEAAKLDALFLQAEEMLAVKLKTTVHAAELRGLATMIETWKREWAKAHTDIRKTQRLLEKEENRTSQDPIYVQVGKLISFLDWTHDHFRALDKTLLQVTRAVAQDQQTLGGMVDLLLEDAKKVLMLPFASALEVLPKMVRDLSRAQGKDVEFTLHGGEVEIDKRILEEMKDPLIHILRNCIDHGIESPAEREQQQKPPRGVISIAIAPSDGNTVEITVTDDGAGIDAAKVKAAAVRCGVLSQKAVEQLSEQEAIALIFQSEVSTSATVSDLSGRGLGMAIVREKVEKLGGQIAVETQRHHGSTFRIRLPLTLATFRGILVQAAGQAFVVPTAHVERVVRIKRDDIHTVGNKEAISLAGYTLPLVRLDCALGLAEKARNEDHGRFQLALVIGQDERQIAFGVDSVVNEQEVLFKSLGKQLVRVRNIAGATVLGSGQVVPVLNVSDLLASAGGASLAVMKTAIEASEEEPQKKSILVAEDSITSRMLLKEILESAGYCVSTAIDGEDAFASLQKATFDLVVSDVEMPRMNGFDLTSKIRGDDRYAQLPVVLVTGLESQTDRERGIDAGANAYVVKGSFDQSNLLETIRRLI